MKEDKPKARALFGETTSRTIPVGKAALAVSVTANDTSLSLELSLGGEGVCVTATDERGLIAIADALSAIGAAAASGLEVVVSFAGKVEARGIDDKFAFNPWEEGGGP